MTSDATGSDTITQSSSVFSMVCRIEIEIHAQKEKVWSLLTDAQDFPRWNSTVNGTFFRPAAAAHQAFLARLRPDIRALRQRLETGIRTHHVMNAESRLT